MPHYMKYINKEIDNRRSGQKRYAVESSPNYIKVAKELHYPDNVIQRLMTAKTESEKLRIMITQRKEGDRR